MQIRSVSDLGATRSSIKCSDACADATLLATILTLGQREIEDGNYRDIGEFLAELDLDD